MNEPTKSLPAEDQAAFDLGEMLGRRQAYGAVAGRCSAADAECMRRIRDQKLYLHRAPAWDEFCPKYLGMSRAHANRIIRALEEFGPVYFEVAQLTRITPEQFRAIAPAVRDRNIHLHGEAIALIPENSDKVAAAVAELRREGATEGAQSPSMVERLSAAQRRADQAIAEFRRLLDDNPLGLNKPLVQSAIRQAIADIQAVER